MANNIPYLLLPYQQRWVEDDSGFKIAEKSRRIGLSWAEAANSTLKAAQSGRNGMDTWYLGANEAGAQEFMLDCAFWTKQYDSICSELTEVVIRDEDKDILAYQIRFASGYRVTGLTSRPTNLRGKKGRVVADEFAFHPDPDGLLKAAIALLMWGGQVSIISTHNGITNAFNQLVEQVRAGKRQASIHRITLDDALAEGLYQRICLTKGENWSEHKQAVWRQELIDSYGTDADEELFCIPKSGGETYFPAVLVQARMSHSYPVFRLSLPDSFNEKPEDDRKREIINWCQEKMEIIFKFIPEHYRCYFGMDFGRVHDLSVIAPIVERPTLKRFVPFILELRNVPNRQQQQILWYVIEHCPQFISGAIDARGNGSTLAEDTAHQFGMKRILQVMLTQEKYRDMMPRYRLALEDDVLELPADSDVALDHGAVKLDNGVPKVPQGLRYKGSDGNFRHGDAVIALMLGWFAATEHATTPLVISNQRLNTSSETNRSAAREPFANQPKVIQAGRSGVRNIF